jgi:hypothetical protein
MTNPKTIFSRQPVRLIQFSVFANGRWNFAVLQNPTKSTPTLQYFRIPYRFGIVAATQTNPAKVKIYGNPGEYVTKNQENILAVISEAQFERLFPRTNVTPKKRGLTSQDLDNPNFLTKTLRESGNGPSDKIQVGNSSFNLKNKTTFTIIDTPVGQAKVSVPLDPSAYSMDPITPPTEDPYPGDYGN